MKIKVSEVIYTLENSGHPTDFEFEIADDICSDDSKLSAEVYKLVKEQTGETLTECSVIVDQNMKRLCRFYCVDCDNAWIELFEEHEYKADYTDKCEYCNKTQQAEEVE